MNIRLTEGICLLTILSALGLLGGMLACPLAQPPRLATAAVPPQGRGPDRVQARLRLPEPELPDQQQRRHSLRRHPGPSIYTKLLTTRTAPAIRTTAIHRRRNTITSQRPSNFADDLSSLRYGPRTSIWLNEISVYYKAQYKLPSGWRKTSDLVSPSDGRLSLSCSSTATIPGLAFPAQVPTNEPQVDRLYYMRAYTGSDDAHPDGRLIMLGIEPRMKTSPALTHSP